MLIRRGGVTLSNTDLKLYRPNQQNKVIQTKQRPPKTEVAKVPLGVLLSHVSMRGLKTV